MKRNLRALLNSIRRRTRPSSRPAPEIVLTPVQARQGFLGKPVLLVLTTSMVLLIVSMVLFAMA